MMPVVSVTSAPLIVTNPSLILNPLEDHPSGAPAVQVNCMMQDLDADADAELVDTDTACDPSGRAYGQPSSEYTLIWRYSPEAYGYLKQFSRSRVGFAGVNDYTAPVSADNREESGILEFPQVAPELHYKRNENKTFTFTLPVVGGEPVSTEDPLAAVITHPMGPVI